MSRKFSDGQRVYQKVAQYRDEYEAWIIIGTYKRSYIVERPIGSLSQGYRTRVSFAAADKGLLSEQEYANLMWEKQHVYKMIDKLHYGKFSTDQYKAIAKIIGYDDGENKTVQEEVDNAVVV